MEKTKKRKRKQAIDWMKFVTRTMRGEGAGGNGQLPGLSQARIDIIYANRFRKPKYILKLINQV